MTLRGRDRSPDRIGRRERRLTRWAGPRATESLPGSLRLEAVYAVASWGRSPKPEWLEESQAHQPESISLCRPAVEDVSRYRGGTRGLRSGSDPRRARRSSG